MPVIELTTVLLATFLGARLGRVDVSFAGGLGVLVLTVIGIKPGDIPFDVTSIIMAAIATISAMQIADGPDYLVHRTEKLLRCNPKYITIFVSIMIYPLTIFADTGNISLAILSVIAKVAKEQGVKPCRPLPTAVVSTQIATTASPISAAAVCMSSVTEGHGVSYLHLLSAVIPSAPSMVLVIFFLVTMLFSSKLSDDPIYRKHLEGGLVELRGEKQIEAKSGVKASVWLFLLGVVGAVIYTVINSPDMGLVEKPLMNVTNATLIIMLSIATLATVICRAGTSNILSSSTFRVGMSTCIYILGATWLGDIFVSNNVDWIKDIAGKVIQGHPWLLAAIFFFASALLYPQAATAKVLMPMALVPNVSPSTAVASFAAASGLFILSAYPTLIAAVQMDGTGATRIDKFIFNHPFFIPGTPGIALTVCFSFVLDSFIL